MTTKELIEILQQYPPHTVVGAYNADSCEIEGVTGATFSPGETGEDHYIEPSVILETDA